MICQRITGRYLLEGKAYISYGIQYNQFTVEDLSMDGEAVDALAELCRRAQPTQEQFLEVIEDFMAAPDDFLCAAYGRGKAV